MNKTLLLTAAVVGLATTAAAQQRQAVIRGGGNANQGKCTIEVVVDGSAEVTVQGSNATLRTTGGQPAQWRRFECTSAMPNNAPNFRFAGVDGRGRQDLIRDPRNGGGAVVAINDPDGGAEGYTFDLIWGGAPGSSFSNAPTQPRDNRDYRDYPNERYRPNYQDSEYYRRYGHGFAADDAVNVCRTEVLRQANARFRSADIHIRQTNIDDNPGRNDWVLGSMDVHRGGFRNGRFGAYERYNFSCSVNFDNGRVRSAQIDASPIR